MANRFNSSKNKPHSLVVTSKMKVMQDFRHIQQKLQALSQTLEQDCATKPRHKRKDITSGAYDVQTFSSFNTSLPIYPRKTAFVDFAA